MAELTISDAARRTGVSADPLRYHERAGLMARVERARSGHAEVQQSLARIDDKITRYKEQTA